MTILSDVGTSLEKELKAGRSRIAWVLSNFPDATTDVPFGPVDISGPFFSREYFLTETGARNQYHRHTKTHKTYLMRGAVLVGVYPDAPPGDKDITGAIVSGDLVGDEYLLANSRDGQFYTGNDTITVVAGTPHIFIALEPSKIICSFAHYNAFDEPSQTFDGIMKWYE